MPPGSGMGRMLILQFVDTLKRFCKRLEIASRNAPIGCRRIVEIHSMTAIVTYKLVTHFTLHN
jgi:hypothetical protein